MELNTLPLGVIQELLAMLRWFRARVQGPPPAVPPGMAALEPPQYGKLTSPLTAPGSATARRRVRNAADDAWETTEEEVEVYTGGDVPAGASWPADTLVRYAWHQDPKFPHLVCTNYSCDVDTTT